MSLYSNQGRYQKTKSVHWIWVIFLVVTLLLCVIAATLAIHLWTDAHSQPSPQNPTTKPLHSDPTELDPPSSSEPQTEPSGSKELVLPDSLQLLAPAVSTSVELLPQELVSGLEGTDIQVSFGETPLREPGVQNVTLLFTSGSASCTRETAVYYFTLNPTKTVDIADMHSASPRDFLQDPALDAAFVESDILLNRCGEHPVKLICDGRQYDVKYIVTESIPPVGVPKTITAQAGTLPDPSDLLESITDDSSVTVTWAQTPELTTVGILPVKLLLTDSYGNTATVTSQIIVIPNENAPQFTGLEDMKIQVGDTVSYKNGVSAVDPQDGAVIFTVDSTGFDRNTVGTYTVYYKATDADGNTTIMPRTIIVQEIGAAVVEERARAALDSIITEGMSKDEMIYAVWYYTLSNVSYVGTSDKSGIIAAAYEGFTTAQGDCYTYYAMNVVMFDMLGIGNVEVRRINGTTNHWWNLVQYEDGLWYHLDSCPSRIWLDEVDKAHMTDSDLVYYTNHPDVLERRPNYYTYDHTLPQYEGLEIAP